MPRSQLPTIFSASSRSWHLVLNLQQTINNTLSRPSNTTGSNTMTTSGQELGLGGPRRMRREGLLLRDCGVGADIPIFYVNKHFGYVRFRVHPVYSWWLLMFVFIDHHYTLSPSVSFSPISSRCSTWLSNATLSTCSSSSTLSPFLFFNPLFGVHLTL